MKQLREFTRKTTNEADFVKSNTELNEVQKGYVKQQERTSAAQERQADANAAVAAESVITAPIMRMLMGAQAHSAKAQGDVSARTAEDAAKYGNTWLGGMFATLERTGKTWADATRRLFQNGPPMGAPPVYVDRDRITQTR